MSCNSVIIIVITSNSSCCSRRTDAEEEFVQFRTKLFACDEIDEEVIVKHKTCDRSGDEEALFDDGRVVEAGD